MVSWSSSVSAPCRDGALSSVLAERFGRDRDDRYRDRSIIDNGGVDVVGLREESSVDGTKPTLQIANGDVHDFGVGNDSGAAAAAIAIDVEPASHAGNTATDRTVRIIRCATAAWNAEPVLRAPTESARQSRRRRTTTLRASVETPPTDLRATVRSGLWRRRGRGLERARRHLLRRRPVDRVQAAPERRLGEKEREQHAAHRPRVSSRPPRRSSRSSVLR